MKSKWRILGLFDAMLDNPQLSLTLQINDNG